MTDEPTPADLARVMAALGRKKSERKAVKSRENGAKNTTEVARAKMRAAQQARRERERLEKEQMK